MTKAIPDWGQPAPQPRDPHRATFMDGVVLGLGMATAWLILVPIIVIVGITLLSSLAGD